MKKISEEIIKGKNLQENLSVYARRMMGIYNDYSFVRLSMNYFTYYEMVSEAESRDENLKEIMDSFNKIVSQGIISSKSGLEWEKLVEDTDNIRNKVINIMKGLTSYADIFNIYEYCLNRVEYRFKDGSQFLKQTDEDLTSEFLQYILKEQDNVVINSRISEVVRQLPMRMTKNKFFQLLREGLKVYKGNSISGVEDFLYMIRTTALIEVSEYTELLSDDMKSIYNEFKNTKFSRITKEKYDDLKAKTEFAVDYIMRSVNMYMLLAELINDVYVIILSSAYRMDESKDGIICNAIIKKVNNMFSEKELSEIYDDITEDFIKLEGRQEALQTKFSSYEYVIDEVLDNHSDMLQSLMLEKVYNSLKRIMALESGSIFVEFYERNESEADQQYIEKVTEELTEQLSRFFAENEKLVNRAVMAHVLSGLPVFFNNTEEIKSYIYNSLKGCSDTAEKSAVTEILRQLQQEDI